MKLIAQLIIACALLPGLQAQAEIAVIVDPSVEVASLDIEQLERLYLRPEAFYADNGIELRTNTTVQAIDRADKSVIFQTLRMAMK